MARGKTSLDNYEYDDWLSSQKKDREVRARQIERKNRGIQGWHFGIDEQPFKTSNKEELRRELDKRGLMLRDDVKRNLR